MPRLFKTNNEVEVLENRAYTLQEIQLMIGGNMASHTISQKPYIHIFCDDDGLAKNLNVNHAFFRYLTQKEVFYPNPIVGNLILFETQEELLIFDGQIDPITKVRIEEK